MSKLINKMKPTYGCSYPGCTRIYRFKSDLKLHCRKKHQDDPIIALMVSPDRSTKLGKPFPCRVPDCPSGYLHAKDRKRHMRVKHSKKKKEPVIEEQSLIRTPTEEDLIIEEEHFGDWPLPPLLPQDFDVY